MYPIAFIGVIAFSVVIERLIMIIIYNKTIRGDIKRFNNMIIETPQMAIDSVRNSQSILGKTLNEAIFEYQTYAIKKEQFEELVSINAVHSVRRLSRRTTVISTFANVATLLGLLGTIMGLIQSFATVVQANSGDHLALLSASVSIAMNTTAFGLMVAIPLLLAYVFIDNASNKALENLQVGCAQVVNRIYSKV